MRRLTLIIEAGEHTCRNGADGPWCPHVYRTGIADRPALTEMCGLFGKPLPEVTKGGRRVPKGKIGWLGRLPECKSAEDATKIPDFLINDAGRAAFNAHPSKDPFDPEALKAGIAAALRSNGVKAHATKSGVRVTAKGLAKCKGKKQ